MAFPNSVLNGSDVLLRVEGKLIACATSHTIELTNATREVACKGSGDFTSAEYGRFSWTVSTDALLNLGLDGDEYISYAELMQIMKAKKVVEVLSYYDGRATNDGAGDGLLVYGKGIITSISQASPDNDNATYSVSITGREELSVETGFVLAAPTGVTAVQGPQAADITVSWTDNNTTPNEAGNRVYWREIGTMEWLRSGVTSPDVTSLDLLGLTSGDYEIKVKAIGDPGATTPTVDSQYSDTVHYTVP